LAKIEAGGHGFDLVVPSANYVPVFIDKGLITELDLAKLPNHRNIASDWRDVSFDPGRKFSIPWQWGTTGVGVNKSVYAGDINTSAVWIEPPEELWGKINISPEMNDILALATMYVGGEICTEDPVVLKKVRDLLLAAKPKWQSMDYGMEDKLATGDVKASVYWSGAIMRARLRNPDVIYGYPKEGFILWSDQVVLLKDAKNVENAYKFLDYIMAPEHAAQLSVFARYANSITGSEAFMPEEMTTAPELVIPPEFKDKGKFLLNCSPKATEYITAIWTELQK
jgi:spermidine/putrescine transport system substrate-binding protein